MESIKNGKNNVKSKEIKKFNKECCQEKEKNIHNKKDLFLWGNKLKKEININKKI